MVNRSQGKGLNLANLPARLRGPGLPDRIYLDTVSVYTWARLGYAPSIIRRLTSNGKTVRVEAAVLAEAEALFGQPIGAALLRSFLANGVERCELAEEFPGVYGLAVQLRRWISDAEEAGTPGLVLRASANLGEAATIAYISSIDPGAVFVTSDRFASEVAAEAEVTVVKTLAFVGLEIAFGDLTPHKLWADVCDTRPCDHDRLECKRDLECPSLTDEAARRGVVGRVPHGRRLVRMINQDLAGLLAASQ